MPDLQDNTINDDYVEMSTVIFTLIIGRSHTVIHHSSLTILLIWNIQTRLSFRNCRI